ncbi:4-alpha-glucanotransferase [Paracoccus beibuensis]|uniref:4-alpha-glucanotransferase n=1 Tax=Paracoccus beibuensis TaxID=547602 RepID=UPI00224078D8|nr:4-alpha-glucanotransferase [Paracoccus beibuensis]
MPEARDLTQRALEHGIQPTYVGMGGEAHLAPEATLEKLLQAFGADPDRPGPLTAEPELRAHPGTRCYLPEDGRAWGVALQLYQLRSARNWGIGDFGDLADMAAVLGAAGADFIGLNPLHALFLSKPRHCSPFSPSNRRFLNPLYIAVDRLHGFQPQMAAEARLKSLRQAEFVDYAGVAALKLPVLRQIWDAAGRPDAAEDLLTEGSADLRRHSLFEALSAWMVAQGHGAGWRDWPEEWQDAEGDAVARFAQTHADDLRFHRWLQQVAQRQLAEAGEACGRAGMTIGLYLDFAVGEASDGSGAWGNPLVVPGVRIGAPPDWFNETGQDWGLAPLSPVEMAAREAAPFATLMEQATRQAGALRIDHAMGLWQLFLIPDGDGPPEGTYARYPVADMLDALARASRQNRTIVIGEDLGNVPPGFREVMDEVGILSYRILLFERTDEGFIPPEDYPRNAMACLSTHDLPTFQGWWRGDDVTLRLKHGLINAAAAQDQAATRVTERDQLLQDLAAVGLWSGAPPVTDAAPEDLVAAVHAFLAKAPSRLLAVRLEDVTGEADPVNIPSTVDEHPNWQRKLGVSVEDIADLPLFRKIANGLQAERPRRGLSR